MSETSNAFCQFHDKTHAICCKVWDAICHTLSYVWSLIVNMKKFFQKMLHPKTQKQPNNQTPKPKQVSKPSDVRPQPSTLNHEQLK